MWGWETAPAREGCWSLTAREMAESQQGQYLGRAGRKMGQSSGARRETCLGRTKTAGSDWTEE